MSLNDRARIRSRWPAVFDIEGIPRDPKIRNQRLEANMQIAKVKQTGTFDFNDPPPQRYEHQEFPRLMYRGDGSLQVNDQGEQEQALEEGYFFSKTEAIEAADPNAATIEEEDQEDAGETTDEEAANEVAEQTPAAHHPAVHHRAKPAKKKKH